MTNSANRASVRSLGANERWVRVPPPRLSSATKQYLGVAQEQSSRLGTAMALVQVQPPRRNYPGVTQQQSMWLLTTLALVQVQPPGPRPIVAQQQSKWLLPTSALVQVQPIGFLDVAQEESACSGCKRPLVRFQSSRLRSFRFDVRLLPPLQDGTRSF